MEQNLRKLFARNARAVLKRDETKRPKLVGQGISDGTADRVLNGEQNLTLDTIAKWVKALEVPAWQLLHPAFDARKPFIVGTEAELEAEVVRRVKEKLEPFVKMYGVLDEQESRPDGRSPGKPFGDLATPAGESDDGKAGKPEGPPPAAEKKARKRQP